MLRPCGSYSARTRTLFAYFRTNWLSELTTKISASQDLLAIFAEFNHFRTELTNYPTSVAVNSVPVAGSRTRTRINKAATRRRCICKIIQNTRPFLSHIQTQTPPSRSRKNTDSVVSDHVLIFPDDRPPITMRLFSTNAQLPQKELLYHRRRSCYVTVRTDGTAAKRGVFVDRPMEQPTHRPEQKGTIECRFFNGYRRALCNPNYSCNVCRHLTAGSWANICKCSCARDVRHLKHAHHSFLFSVRSTNVAITELD